MFGRKRLPTFFGRHITPQGVSVSTAAEKRQPAHAQDNDYVYIKQIQPNDIFQATGNDDIADSNLVQSRQESQRIYDGLQELANNARNQKYTGLQRRKISKGRQRYDELKVRVAILSRAVDQMN
ncbi:MAG: hypothetical protein ACLFRF_04580, partial [Desulfobacterales bacterium]